VHAGGGGGGYKMKINSNFELNVIYFGNFSVPLRFSWFFSLRSLSFRLCFPVFRFEAKQAKKQLFFASKRKKICLIFASFRFNRKRTAHPSGDIAFKSRIDTKVNFFPAKYEIIRKLKFLSRNFGTIILMNIAESLLTKIIDKNFAKFH
jgi:hypothetical protein